MALISIIAIQNLDPDIWRGFRVPGRPDIRPDIEPVPDPFIPDRQVAIDYILMSCGELSLVYSDPVYLRYAIRSWTARRFPVWAELYNTMIYRYNPIWNKDGSFTETRDLSRSENEQTAGSVNSSGSTDADLRGNVTAYDTNSYSPYDQQIQDITTGSHADHSGSRDEAGTEKETVTRTEKGNIGVTTTQQMIKEQREIAGFSLYDVIMQDFKTEFCVMVY